MDEPCSSQQEPPDEQPRSTLLALITSGRGGATCTFYPPGVVVPRRGTRWIRANKADVVDLDECR